MQKKIIQTKRRTGANHESNFQFLCWLRFPIDHSLVFELMKQKLTFTSSLLGVQSLVLAYMAINIDFDDNKPHIFIKQRFMNCAFIIRK